MKQLWILMGKLTFLASWPALWVYFHFGSRTRVVMVTDGKVLLVKGWLGPGKWSLPGGGLHAGEQPTHGAIREVHEETGILLTEKDLQPLSSGRFMAYGLKFNGVAFWVDVNQLATIKPQNLEIVDAQWVDIITLDSHTISADTQQLLTQWSRRG